MHTDNTRVGHYDIFDLFYYLPLHLFSGAVALRGVTTFARKLYQFRIGHAYGRRDIGEWALERGLI